MRRTLLVLAIAAAFAIAGLGLAPATLADVWMRHASHDAVRVAAAEGTIWRGRGTLVAGSDKRLPLAWSLDPWPLLRGEMRMVLSPYDAAATLPRGDISVRARTVALRGLDATLPAALLRDLAESGMDVTGEVRITTPSLDIDVDALRGGLEVAWRDAHIASSRDAGIDLGSLSATLTADGRVLRGPVANRGGDVDVAGSVAAGAAGTQISLLITPRRADDATTARLLSSIGTPEGGGYRVVLRR